MPFILYSNCWLIICWYMQDIWMGQHPGTGSAIDPYSDYSLQIQNYSPQESLLFFSWWWEPHLTIPTCCLHHSCSVTIFSNDNSNLIRISPNQVRRSKRQHIPSQTWQLAESATSVIPPLALYLNGSSPIRAFRSLKIGSQVSTWLSKTDAEDTPCLRNSLKEFYFSNLITRRSPLHQRRSGGYPAATIASR